MNEEALRALIRESVARHLGAQPPRPAPPFTSPASFLAPHPSQYRYQLPESDGQCLIEPCVTCNHCGFCQSHGH